MTMKICALCSRHFRERECYCPFCGPESWNVSATPIANIGLGLMLGWAVASCTDRETSGGGTSGGQASSSTDASDAPSPTSNSSSNTSPMTTVSDSSTSDSPMSDSSTTNPSTSSSSG